jgi:hypothetical protein
MSSSSELTSRDRYAALLLPGFMISQMFNPASPPRSCSRSSRERFGAGRSSKRSPSESRSSESGGVERRRARFGDRERRGAGLDDEVGLEETAAALFLVKERVAEDLEVESCGLDEEAGGLEDEATADAFLARAGAEGLAEETGAVLEEAGTDGPQ